MSTVRVEVEVEDAGWTAALPDAVARVEQAAMAASSSPPLRGRGQGEGGVSATSAEVALTPPPPTPSPQGGGDISVILTSDAEIQALNARFRGQDKATNVLSFPAGAHAGGHLGDLALALGVCTREAAEQGKPLAHHLMHLVVHGVLHLVGHDHDVDADAEAMEALERRILAGLGVPDPYAEPLTEPQARRAS